jgi:hypothetical protein
MAHFVLMDDTVSGVFLKAWKRLSDKEFKRVFGLVSDHKVDGREFIVPLNNDDLFGIRVLYCNHGSENSHLNSRIINLY